jgi:multiple sugar transport system permease protein
MTGGGPMNQTMSVVLYMYNHGFKYYNLGYASSIAYVLFALILLSSVAQSLIRKALEGGRK